MQVIIRDQVSAVLDGIGAKRTTKAVSEAMGLAVVSLAIRSFNDSSVRAAPWADLKESTIAEKAKAGKSSAILKRNTLLFRSWRVIEATAAHARVGSDRAAGKWSLAGIHQWGTRDGRISARPMLPMIGEPGSATFTPLAIRRMTEVGQASLAHQLLPGKAPKPQTK